MAATGTFFRYVRIVRDHSSVRVTRAKEVFLHCGVDYAGPIPVRMNPGRVHKSTKTHFASFYIHSKSRCALQIGRVLYNVYAFLASYDRFSSRRSLPIPIYSDNGTSFQGTDKEVTAATAATLFRKLANDQVVWNFIPQLYSFSHSGGLWETGIRSTKYHLKRVIGAHTLFFE